MKPGARIAKKVASTSSQAIFSKTSLGYWRCACAGLYSKRRAHSAPHWRRRNVPGNHSVSIFEPRGHSSRATVRQEPTIYALSTAPGRAAIAVIRISGAACTAIYHALCPGTALPQPRVATVRPLYEPGTSTRDGILLDSQALVLFFPAPRSATGEDMLELQVHGGPAIVRAILSALSRCSGSVAGAMVRPAEAGEFTLRAFLHGRIDLTRAEALGDALSAETEQQRRLAVRGGRASALAQRYEAWRGLLLAARAELEALIDFSEDQHFDESPAQLCASVAAQVVALARALRVHAANAVRGEMLRHGITVALLGAPNAGKSSLLNRVVGREAAIVSTQAGTTRDVIEIGLDVGGYFCRVGDTAGLRQVGAGGVFEGKKEEEISPIEREGMRRAKQRAEESDVVVVVVSFERSSGNASLRLDAEVAATAAQLVGEKGNVVVAINKCDLAHNHQAHEAAVQLITAAVPGLSSQDIYTISCRDAERSTATESDPGRIQTFLHGLTRKFVQLTAARNGEEESGVLHEPDPSVWQDSLGASQRHRALLEQCIASLDAFVAEVGDDLCREDDTTPTLQDQPGDTAGADIVVAAEHLRSAADCLARITGKGLVGDVEEMLGIVFEKFCVGK